MERKTIADLYVRLSRDCRHTMDAISLAHFTADVLKISALEVWLAMPSLSVMELVAAGKHPACQRTDL